MKRWSVLLLLTFTLPALAAEWALQPGSTLGFSGSYDGEAFAGHFAKFTPQIRFDPAKPTSSRFDVRIQLASADTGNSERDDVLRGNDFFNAARMPEARFVASKFRALGGNRYAADGTLSLRGISRPVTLNFTWTAGVNAVLTGEATLKRLDFKIGEGDWADTDLLPNMVKVKTRLVLKLHP